MFPDHLKAELGQRLLKVLDFLKVLSRRKILVPHLQDAYGVKGTSQSWILQVSGAAMMVGPITLHKGVILFGGMEKAPR